MARHRVPKIGRQPHYHPQPGGLDGRGNCPACADYDPEKYGYFGIGQFGAFLSELIYGNRDKRAEDSFVNRSVGNKEEIIERESHGIGR